MNSAPTPKRQGRRLTLLGALIMVLGVVIAATAAVPIVRAFSDCLRRRADQPGVHGPVRRVRPAAPGQVPAAGIGGCQRPGQPGRGTGDRHQPALPRPTSGRAPGTTRWSANSERFVDVIEFTTPHAGRYRVDVSYPPQARLIVSQDPADALGGVAGWFGVGGVGGLVLVLGLVLLLIGLFRGRPAGAVTGAGLLRTAAAWPPPPGWYPDPQRPGGWRYWDGYRWQP